MELRRYRTPTVSEGLSRARTELGPDAVILSTRKVSRRAWLPWIGGREVEVTAAVGSQVSDNRLFVPATTTPIAPFSVTAVPGTSGQDASCDEIAARLRAGGVDDEFALKIATAIPARRRRGMSYTGLVETLTERFASLVANDTRQKPVEVVVGPPGSGKTTTVAKLAARARALQGIRLGLVAADGFRVGAIEQLRIYADVIGVPFTVATTAYALELAIGGRQEPVLVDTAGRAPGDRVAQELMASLSRRTDVRIHIVIDAGQSVEQIHRVFAAYRDARPDRIVVTKVDQIRSLGPLLGVLGEVGIPVSYLCAGQRVPEDIEVASARFLAESVLGENR